jgi:arylamine N-acetyltransferase
MYRQHVFTESQVRQYPERIKFPSTRLPITPNVENLRILVACVQSTIPWENITLQYSKQYTMALQKDSNFKNLIIRRRGGSCPEKAPSFARLLNTFGYDVYMVMAQFWNADTDPAPATLMSS